MIDVVTDLLGEIVEVRDDGGLAARGAVRAVFVDPSVNGPIGILVERDDPQSARDGGVELYQLSQNSIRVVQFCQHCGTWDLKKRLDAWQWPGQWTHKDGEGCKKVTP